MDIFVRNGKVEELTEEQSKQLQKKGVSVHEITKNMTAEELAVFKQERYDKFIKPLMNHNREKLDKIKRGE